MESDGFDFVGWIGKVVRKGGIFKKLGALLGCMPHHSRTNFRMGERENSKENERVGREVGLLK